MPRRNRKALVGGAKQQQSHRREAWLAKRQGVVSFAKSKK